MGGTREHVPYEDFWAHLDPDLHFPIPHNVFCALFSCKTAILCALNPPGERHVVCLSILVLGHNQFNLYFLIHYSLWNGEPATTTTNLSNFLDRLVSMRSKQIQTSYLKATVVPPFHLHQL